MSTKSDFEWLAKSCCPDCHQPTLIELPINGPYTMLDCDTCGSGWNTAWAGDIDPTLISVHRRRSPTRGG